MSVTALLPSSICYRLHEMFCGKVRKIMVNMIKVCKINESILDIDAMLLSYPGDNIPTSAAIFVYNGAFDIARSVRNVLGCTLLRDVMLACNKHLDTLILWILRRFYYLLY